jgi:cellulose synthase/poly-beta-1,6-N-acetylglucosamine synthase-like glycosyltransferase
VDIAGWIIIAVLVAELFVTGQILCNLFYDRKEVRRKRGLFNPKCVLIVPCKGLDEAFDENIESFFMQDYHPYHLRFVVQEQEDPAYEQLNILKERLGDKTKALSVEILIAGLTSSASQKLHNLLYAYQHIPDDTEMLAFADSDACAGEHWLRDLLNPLELDKNGVTSGYRGFIPKVRNFATLAMSAGNAKVCQFLGNSRFNLAWGGSMGISVRNFREFGMEEIWSTSLSDDLSLSLAVRKHHRKVVFAPRCMTAGFVSTTWAELWEFTRRQFMISRVYTPKMWLFSFVSSLVSGLGVPIALAVAVVMNHKGYANAHLYFWLAVILFGFQACRMVIRQQIMNILLPEYKDELRWVRILDVFFFWGFSILLFLMIASSAYGRTITWRNIRYRMLGPDNIQILKK